MISIKLSKDVHYVKKHKPAFHLGPLKFEECHEIPCMGEEDTIERVSQNVYEVTCTMCLGEING